jgi:hypothetical protein
MPMKAVNIAVHTKLGKVSSKFCPKREISILSYCIINSVILGDKLMIEKKFQMEKESQQLHFEKKDSIQHNR